MSRPGADYEKANRSLLAGSTTSSQSGPNQTQYICPGSGILFAVGAQIRAETYIQTPFVISRLSAHSHNPPGAGETYDYTLMVNGIATALTCQTAGAVATESSDLVNAVAVVPGDYLTLRIVSSLNAVASYHTWSMELVN